MRVLVTGGAGFIGSAFIRNCLSATDFEIANLDKLTYAGNLENLASVADSSRYSFFKGDICDSARVNGIFSEVKPQFIVHFAAESHVDRSILTPEPAVQTNLLGSFTLLEAARRYGVQRLLHVSTDEVYGSIAPPAEADEEFPLRASSPYSATKAGSDLLAFSYFQTYGLPVIVTRASNNFGPYQFPEKLIPLMISNALENRPLPVYGDGLQVRDWLYVDDHCDALKAVLRQGTPGEVYNIGGSHSLPNLEMVRWILALTGRPETLIQHVTDRPGHDRRYALCTEKLRRVTGWLPKTPFDKGLAQTIEWYRRNLGWVSRVRSGEYRDYYERNYGARLSGAGKAAPS